MLVSRWISLNKEAADAVANRQLSSNPVTQQFKYASDAGFNTLRIFGYGAEGFGSNFLLQTAPGELSFHDRQMKTFLSKGRLGQTEAV